LIARKSAGEGSSKKVTGLASVRPHSHIRFLERFRITRDVHRGDVARLDKAITRLKCCGSLYRDPRRWHRHHVPSELRTIRRALNLKQAAFAAILHVSLESLRTWDSGRRPVPLPILQRARAIRTTQPAETPPSREAVSGASIQVDSQLLSLDQLAREFQIHERTLRAAARRGHLDVQFSRRSVFGRPIRRANRAAARRFLDTKYRHFEGHGTSSPPLPLVPDDFDVRLKRLRELRRWSQSSLAHHIGAANKAVIYQWESRKRRPSPVLWRGVMELIETDDTRPYADQREDLAAKAQPSGDPNVAG
jgi:DNA-binding transcriptional regulator YiaG